MRKLVVTAFTSVLLAACSGQSTAPVTTPAQGTTPPPQSTPAPVPSPTPIVAAIVDATKIAGKSQKEVAQLLGEPISCETIKQGKKCSFTPGETEVVFISGKADWITVEALDSAPFSEDVLPLLGIEKTPATFSNDNVMRWDTVPGLLEVSVFPTATGVDYAYIFVSNEAVA